MNDGLRDRPRVLIAGVGNIFLGDDAFGVEVVQRLAHRRLPDGVRVADFGIRSLDLVYALLDGYESVILVDALPRGGVPGTLYVIEPDAAQWRAPAEHGLLQGHGMDLVQVLRQAAALGCTVQRVLLVGCEPAAVGDDDMAPGLSEPVRAAVDDAVRLVEDVAARLLAGQDAALPT